MKYKEKQDNAPSPIPWHPAFVEALQMELEDYRDILEFHPEFQLTAEPLRIDCIVIKKAKGVTIKKNIAAIFREINLVEYKSPGDYVSVDDFYKVYGYACLYASFEKVPITSLTVSFVESHYPGKLLKHLKSIRRFTIEETNNGIYTARGDILPIQIINNLRLAEDENLWLKGLSNRLDPLSVIRISDEVIRQSKTAKIQAYIHAIAKANFHIIEEAINMNNAARSLDEVLVRTGLDAKAEARGKERKAIDIAQKMLSSGFPLETVASMTELDVETIRKLGNVPK